MRLAKVSLSLKDWEVGMGEEEIWLSGQLLPVKQYGGIIITIFTKLEEYRLLTMSFFFVIASSCTWGRVGCFTWTEGFALSIVWMYCRELCSLTAFAQVYSCFIKCLSEIFQL